jgi:D-sedoheptulose 7-phosphate isomerase
MEKYNFQDSLSKTTNLLSSLQSADFLSRIELLGEKIVQSLGQGGKLVTFGNGGSAAEASHFATELVSKCSRNHEPWAAISLSDSGSNLTAIGNDYGFDNVFARQIQGLAGMKDCVVGFSTSGKSPNILRGLNAAYELGCTTYLVTGESYSPGPEFPWEAIVVPSRETTKIQEAHLWMIHALSEYCESRIHPKANS